MFFVAGGEPVHLLASPRRRCRPRSSFMRGLPAGPVQAFGSTRSRTPLGAGFHSVQGLLALGARRALRGRPGREPAAGGLVLPERLQRLHLRDHRPGVRLRRGRARSSALFVLLAYRGIRIALARARHLRGAAGGRDHRLALPPGVRQHRGRRGAPPGHGDHAPVRLAPAAPRSSSAWPRSGSSSRSRARPSSHGAVDRCAC